MGELIDDLLRLSRVTQSELVRERIDVSAMAHEVVTALARQSPRRKVTVNIEANLVAEADPGLLRVALENLLRSEEHTSELQSLMRISYAVFCLKKKTNN